MKNKRWRAARAALLVAATLALIAARELGAFRGIDESIYSLFPSSENIVMRIITETASIYSFAIVIVLIAIYQLMKFRGFRIELLNFVSALVLTSLITLALKYFTASPRPGEILVSSPSIFSLLSDVYSFPSGHSSRASVASYFLSKKGRLWALLGWSYVILISFSRIFLAVHWTSDVVVGVFLGAACSDVVDFESKHLIKLYKSILRKRERILD
ncbi:MAG: phosphatase PAP2 family protein [Fervidicoccaceae archaeon]